MPATCIIVGCTSRAGRDKLRFFKLPTPKMRNVHMPLLQELTILRRQSWLQSLRRTDLNETMVKNMRFCERHFIGREPANIYDKDSPDWVPSLNMGYKTSLPGAQNRLKRHERAKARRQKMLLREENYMINNIELAHTFPMLHEQLLPVDALIADKPASYLGVTNPLDLNNVEIEISKDPEAKAVPNKESIPLFAAANCSSGISEHVLERIDLTDTTIQQDEIPVVDCQYTVQTDEGITNTVMIPGALIPGLQPPLDDSDKFGNFVVSKLKGLKTDYCRSRVKEVITKYLCRMEVYDAQLDSQIQECLQPISKLQEHSYAMLC